MTLPRLSLWNAFSAPFEVFQIHHAPPLKFKFTFPAPELPCFIDMVALVFPSWPLSVRKRVPADGGCVFLPRLSLHPQGPSGCRVLGRYPTGVTKHAP